MAYEELADYLIEPSVTMNKIFRSVASSSVLRDASRVDMALHKACCDP
jgi:hypothetical protein